MVDRLTTSDIGKGTKSGACVRSDPFQVASDGRVHVTVDADLWRRTPEAIMLFGLEAFDAKLSEWRHYYSGVTWPGMRNQRAEMPTHDIQTPAGQYRAFAMVAADIDFGLKVEVIDGLG